MQPLDYEVPSKRKKSALPFWIVFGATYLPGLLVLNTVDDLLHRRWTGGHNDGGVMCISLGLAPVFAVTAALIKRRWKRYDSVLFAATFSVCGPLLTYLLFVSIGLAVRG